METGAVSFHSLAVLLFNIDQERQPLITWGILQRPLLNDGLCRQNVRM